MWPVGNVWSVPDCLDWLLHGIHHCPATRSFSIVAKPKEPIPHLPGSPSTFTPSAKCRQRNKWNRMWNVVERPARSTWGWWVVGYREEGAISRPRYVVCTLLGKRCGGGPGTRAIAWCMSCKWIRFWLTTQLLHVATAKTCKGATLSHKKMHDFLESLFHVVRLVLLS